MFCAVITYLTYPFNHEQQYFVLFAMQLVIGGALITSTCLMRRAVNSISFVQPNDCFVILHVVCFSSLIMMSFILAIIKATGAFSEETYFIASTVQYTVGSLTSATLDILLARFILHKHENKHNDPILYKKVNPIVFIQNLNLNQNELNQ